MNLPVSRSSSLRACPPPDANPTRSPLGNWEKAALAYAGILVVFASWAFGGNVDWSRRLISWSGLAGALLAVAAAVHGDGRRRLLGLWPLLAFNAVVLASSFNPSFSARHFNGETVLVHTGGTSWWPSTADPAASRRALWIFDAVFLAGFNLLLHVRQRRALRGLLTVTAANALVLSVFGTLQKLTGAGLFFGLRQSPNPFFFSSFIYHNHWGAFIVLAVAASAGLVFNFSTRHQARDFWHSPAFGGTVGLFFMALTAPLSESRSGTVLIGLLLATMLGHAWWRSQRKQAFSAKRTAWMLAGMLFVAAVLAFTAYELDQRGINKRAELTRQQMEELHANGLGSRGVLYRDTWRMACDQPWLGWGFGSYSMVFQLYNTQHSVDRLPVFYAQAHSDWLQSLAETGLVGTALTGLLAALPLLRLRRRHLADPVVLYTLLGCALILLYAWIEFPFECPAVAATFWINFFSAVRCGQLAPAGEKAR
ncbi:MAG TPA: O-antigen ligase family protein [Opitutaceae bacterium]|nr:O-antigen ligase family protein [Opitutaceae bacterium]